MSAPSRKRRRPPVVCSECRRRKSACDRRIPCAQCTQHGLVCVYQNDRSTSQRSAPGPSRESLITATINTSSERPRISVTASEDTAAIVATPRVRATPLGGSIEGAQNDATFPIPGAIRTPPVTASSTSGTLNQGEGHLQPQNRAWVNFDGTLSQNGQSLFARDRQTSDHKGRYLKSRLVGQSHWMNGCFQFGELLMASSASLFSVSSPATVLLQKCKSLASQLKASRPVRTHLDLRSCIPPKNLCHQLKQAYFQTFESVFRVLHVPSFERDYNQYWDDPQMTSDSFVVRLLLVVAIGTCFHEDPTNSGPSLHESSAQWILAANRCLSGPVEKRHLNLGGIQNHCLLLLALQTNAVGGDLTWITAGSLVRTAMSVGLHRDPIHFPHMTNLQTELRRRLWYTTLELAIQASLDSGMPPLITCADYDCEPPSNIDDCQIDEETTSASQAKSDATFTETSMLRMLARSLPSRIETAQLLNGLHCDTSYQAITTLGDKLTQAYRENSQYFQAYNDTGSPDHEKPSTFATKMVDTLCRRFLLSLHTPFAHKAALEPIYYFSRKVCLDASLLLLSYATISRASGPQTQDDDFTRLMLVGRGAFRSVLLHTASTVCFEVMTALREDSSPPTLARANTSHIQAVREVVAVTWQRIQWGETSVKGHVFFVCALAQIEAMQASLSIQLATTEAAQNCLQSCVAVLETRVRETANLAEGSTHGLRDELGFDTGFDQGSLTDCFDANLDYSLDVDDDRWLSSLWLDE